MLTNSLPQLICLNEHGGDWPVYLDVIYKCYLDTVVNGRILYRNLPVKCQFRPAHENKGFAFWHAISEGSDEESRLPDLRRCERIAWIAWVIRNAKDGLGNQVTWWENTRGPNTHIVFLLEEENYVVVLAKRKGFFLLKTAYCANPHRKRQLVQERDRFWKAQKD